jgi:excisionase family DNA binding protein
LFPAVSVTAEVEPGVAESDPSAPLTTAEAAKLLKLSEDFVRAHAAELGGSRISGPRSALRFERARLNRWLRTRQIEPTPTTQPCRKPGPRRGARAVDLLPLPEAD